MLTPFDHAALYGSEDDGGARVAMSRQFWQFLQAHDDLDDRGLIIQIFLLVTFPLAFQALDR